jgi:hypothetical protein
VAEATKVMNSFSASELAAPDLAAYYGIINADHGDPARVTAALDLGEKAELLPEEKTLMQDAREKLVRRAEEKKKAEANAQNAAR